MDKYLLGVFETPWSAASAVQMEYRRQDIRAVASHRWDRLHLTEVTRSSEGDVVEVTIQNTRVPVAHLVAFTYRQGRIILLNPLVIEESDGNEITVNLPLVERLKRPGLSVQPVRFKLEQP